MQFFLFLHIPSYTYSFETLNLSLQKWRWWCLRWCRPVHHYSNNECKLNIHVFTLLWTNICRICPLNSALLMMCFLPTVSVGHDHPFHGGQAFRSCRRLGEVERHLRFLKKMGKLIETEDVEDSPSRNAGNVIGTPKIVWRWLWRGPGWWRDVYDCLFSNDGIWLGKQLVWLFDIMTNFGFEFWNTKQKCPWLSLLLSGIVDMWV